MTCRCVCKHVKKQIELIPGFSLVLSRQGTKDITDSFFGRFAHPSIVCKHIGGPSNSWLDAMLAAMDGGLSIQLLDIVLKDDVITDVLASLLRAPGIVRLQRMQLHYEVSGHTDPLLMEE